MKKENMAMLCDFYEFTMSNGYFKNGFYKKNVYFDVFFRKVPDNGGFAIMAGLERLLNISGNFILKMRISSISRARAFLTSSFLSI